MSTNITFELSDEFNNIYDNDKYTYYSAKFVYNFSFSIRIHSVMTANHITVYKNGQETDDLEVFAEGANYYTVREKTILKRGNYNYSVQVIMSGGIIYNDDFYFKIISPAEANDIKIWAFATYGLHENYNNLRVILNARTNNNIDCVKLYSHICPQTHYSPASYGITEKLDSIIFKNNTYNNVWKYLGEMEYDSGQYVYTDLLFDTSMGQQDRQMMYKAIIYLSNGNTREVSLTTLITPNSFSLNKINYNNLTSAQYDIYGGICGKINNAQSKFNNQIFEFIIYKSTTQYLILNVINGYQFYAENFKITYPQKYIKNATNVLPNTFIFTGRGTAKYNNMCDTCDFDITLLVGDDIYFIANVRPVHNDDLALDTQKTVNNIVRYNNTKYISNDDIELAEDQTASNDSQEGFFTYNEQQLTFYNTDFVSQLVNMENSVIDYFDNADQILYNNKNIYFISYDGLGFHIIKFDGSNYTNIDYKAYLKDNTIQYLKNNMCFNFDTNENLTLNVINSNEQEVLEKISIADDDITIIDCSNIVTSIYNNIKTNMVNYLNNIDIVVDDNDIQYKITPSNEYTILKHEFHSMNLDNFNAQYSMQEFTYSFTVDITVQFINASSGKIIKYSSVLELTSVASVSILNDNYNIEMQRYSITIDDDYLKYTHIDDTKNQKPKNIMERLNCNYFLKFNSSISSSDKDDYGNYRQCLLYNKANRIYNISLEDLYGKGTEQKYFKYIDVCHAKAFLFNSDTLWLINSYNSKVIISIIDLMEQERIKQYIYDTKVYFNNTYSFTEKQLSDFSNLLISPYENEVVERNMYIYAVSDLDNLYVYNLAKKKLALNEMINLNGNIKDKTKSFTYTTNVGWPINIKNQSNCLVNIYFAKE